jgi:hypothetical protein
VIYGDRNWQAGAQAKLCALVCLTAQLKTAMIMALDGHRGRNRVIFIGVVRYEKVSSLLGGSVRALRLKYIADYVALQYVTSHRHITHSDCISPEAYLSSMPNLESLSIGFRVPRSRPNWPDPRNRRLPLLTNVVLPALTSFHVHGGSKYIQDLQVVS